MTIFINESIVEYAALTSSGYLGYAVADEATEPRIQRGLTGISRIESLQPPW